MLFVDAIECFWGFFFIKFFYVHIIYFIKCNSYETCIMDSQVFFKLGTWFDAEIFLLKWGFFLIV